MKTVVARYSHSLPEVIYVPSWLHVSLPHYYQVLLNCSSDGAQSKIVLTYNLEE